MKKELSEMNEEELRAELDSVRSQPPAPSAQPVVTPAAPAEMSEEQWGVLEEQTGMSRQQIIATNNISEFHTKPLREENAALRQQLGSDKNVKAALNKAKSEDAEYPKYATHVQTYIDRLPEATKADPVKLAEEMKFAVGYAKGQVPRKGDNVEPFGGERFGENGGGEGAKGSDEDKYFNTVHMSKDHTVRMTTEKLVSDEFRDAHRHPEIEGGVSIKQGLEWKASETAHRSKQFDWKNGEPKK